MPQQAEQTQEELDATAAQQAAADKPVIDWEAEDNPYKKRYADSQGQIQPLVRTLNQFSEYDHNTKTWKPKTQVAPQQHPQGDDDVEKLLEGYDPEFKKSLGTYTQRQIEKALNKFNEQNVFMSEYNSGITAARSKALEEFGSEFDFGKGGKFNAESPLYKMANEILTTKYAQFNPDGTFHRYKSADAEYMATVEAYAILARRAKQPQPEKGKLNAIQGKGSKSSGVKTKLTYDEYSKLSNDDKDAYDLSQTN